MPTTPSRRPVSFAVVFILGGAALLHLLLPPEEDADGFPKHNLRYLLIVPALASLWLFGVLARGFLTRWRDRRK